MTTSIMMRVLELVVVLCVVAASQLPRGNANQCGWQAGGIVCPNSACCSEWGFCGTTDDYCCTGCQSQCSGCGGGGGGGGDDGGDGYLSDLIDVTTFNELLKHRDNGACPARGFYTYDAFIAAAKNFANFANVGDTDTRKREIAAFLAQTSHETTGGWATAPDGPYSWGYCFVREVYSGDYCSPSPTYPCAAGQQYYGRGPMQLSWNYNYGMCGIALGVDLINNPDLVATDPLLSFTTALWFWMTPEPTSGKPSCHDVIVGNWTPTEADEHAGRVPGFGVTTNIINGGLECGKGPNPQVEDRIGFFKRYCDFFNIGYGENLDCYTQNPFGWGVSEKVQLASAI